MYFRKNNEIDDELEFEKKKKSSKKKQTKKADISFLKLPLIIISALILLIIIILLINKALNKKEIVYEDKLYYINLVGDSNIILYLDEEYNEPGYSGRDDLDNDLTKDVAVTNNIDTSKVGTYKVSYTLGNITKERNIKVIEKPIGATRIHLYGDANIFLYVSEKYEEKGYEVVDTVDGAKLRDQVKINSNVDTSKEGIYHIIYSVTNTSGVTTSVERTVIVMDRTLSLLIDNDDMTNKNVIINIYAKDELFDYLKLPNGKTITERISTYEVSDNGTYKFIMYNTKGESKEKSITISNVDKEKPNGSCSGYYKEGISQIEVKASDNSGISKYVIDDNTYTTSNIKLNKEVDNVSITIYDKAGNTKEISCQLANKNPKTTTTTKTTTKVTTSNTTVKTIPSKTTTKTTTRTTTRTTTSKPITTAPLTNIPMIDSNYPPKAYDKNVSVNYFKGKKGFSYWLYIPDKVTTNLPVVIFLHGYGTPMGNDYYLTNYKHGYGLAYGPIRDHTKFGYNYNAIVIAPQVPKDDKVYGYLSSYVQLVNRINEVYKINTRKISVMGLSHGCYGVGQFVTDYPNYFSAAVPMGCDLLIFDEHKFVSTPIWAFSGSGDGSSQMPKFVDKLNAIGGNAKYTHPEGAPHHLMRDEYSVLRDDDYRIMDWMISQTRN